MSDRDKISDLTKLFRDRSETKNFEERIKNIFSEMSPKGLAWFYLNSSGPERETVINYIEDGVSEEISGDFYKYTANRTLIKPSDLDEEYKVKKKKR